MKEATGERSMTIITIVVIVGLIVAAGVVIGVMVSSANSKATDASNTATPDYCTSLGKTYNAATNSCQ